MCGNRAVMRRPPPGRRGVLDSRLCFANRVCKRSPSHCAHKMGRKWLHLYKLNVLIGDRDLGGRRNHCSTNEVPQPGAGGQKHSSVGKASRFHESVEGILQICRLRGVRRGKIFERCRTCWGKSFDRIWTASPLRCPSKQNDYIVRMTAPGSMVQGHIAKSASCFSLRI